MPAVGGPTVHHRVGVHHPYGAHGRTGVHSGVRQAGGLQHGPGGALRLRLGDGLALGGTVRRYGHFVDEEELSESDPFPGPSCSCSFSFFSGPAGGSAQSSLPPGP